MKGDKKVMLYNVKIPFHFFSPNVLQSLGRLYISFLLIRKVTQLFLFINKVSLILEETISESIGFVMKGF